MTTLTLFLCFLSSSWMCCICLTPHSGMYSLLPGKLLVHCSPPDQLPFQRCNLSGMPSQMIIYPSSCFSSMNYTLNDNYIYQQLDTFLLAFFLLKKVAITYYSFKAKFYSFKAIEQKKETQCYVCWFPLFPVFFFQSVAQPQNLIKRISKRAFERTWETAGKEKSNSFLVSSDGSTLESFFFFC